MKQVVTVLAAILVIPTITSCGSSDPLKITGSFSLRSDNLAGSWDSWSGRGGYSDFGRGMNVTVRNGAGEIIGSGQTRNLRTDDLGRLADDDSDTDDKPPTALESAALFAQLLERTRCTVWFEAEIAEADFYSVSVGRRGELTYSSRELEEKNWHIELSLGD